MLRALTIAAALALASCNQSTSTATNATGSTSNQGSTTERVMARVSTPQDNLTAEERVQLEGVIREYLNSSARANASGFTATPNGESIAPLQPLTNHDFAVALASGVNYKIVGGCDNECNNVDLELRNAAGQVVASDVAPDDHPVISFTPSAAGQYSIRVLLKTCTIAPCYVGARVLQQ